MTPEPMTPMDRALAAVEAVEQDAPGATSEGAAEAIAAAAADAAAKLFPTTIEPTSADVYAALSYHTRQFGAREYGTRLASLHARALGSWDALAASIRQADHLADVATAASASGLSREQAIRRFQSTIARQLVAAEDKLAGAGRNFLDALALERRLAAEAERRDHDPILDELQQKLETARRTPHLRHTIARLEQVVTARRVGAVTDAVARSHLGEGADR